MRRVYVWLIAAHPRAFRERFGEEMIGIFDALVGGGEGAGGGDAVGGGEALGGRAAASGGEALRGAEAVRGEASPRGQALRLVADAARSLVRQRWLRPRASSGAEAGGAVRLADGPSFALIEEALPRRSALVNGGVITFALLALMIFGVGRNTSFPRMLIGARYPRPSVLPVDRASVAESGLTSEVMVPHPEMDPLVALAKVYSGIVRVVEVVDNDGDGTLSAREIGVASVRLWRLDGDHDDTLSAEECGLRFEAVKPDAPAARWAEASFLRFHPVLNALDADHNGRVSRSEILWSSSALHALDQDGDGALSPAEYLPGAISAQAARAFTAGAADALAGPAVAVLRKADRNHDGFTTSEELDAELKWIEARMRQVERMRKRAR